MKLLLTERIEPGFIEIKGRRIDIDDVTHCVHEEKCTVIYGAGIELVTEVALRSLLAFYGDRFVPIRRGAIVNRSKLLSVVAMRHGFVAHVDGVATPLRASRRGWQIARAAIGQPLRPAGRERNVIKVAALRHLGREAIAARTGLSYSTIHSIRRELDAVGAPLTF